MSVLLKSPEGLFLDTGELNQHTEHVEKAFITTLFTGAHRQRPPRAPQWVSRDALGRGV